MLTRQTLQEEREINKDGSIACGVFIPIPYNLAKDFPDKSAHDDSVPHFTILYVGDASPEAYKTLCQVVRNVAKVVRPFQIDLANYSEFTNKAGLKIAHMGPSLIGRMRLAVLHGLVRRAIDSLEKPGIEIKHTYGVSGVPGASYEQQFLAHATLAYLPQAVPYTGPKPVGSWMVNEIECWGHEKIRIPLGRTKAIQPIGLTRDPLAIDYPMAVPVVERSKTQRENVEWVDKLPGGLADKATPGDFDPAQLALGIKVELEHTKDANLAKEIAMDHLKEDPRYYIKLKKVHHEDDGDMTRLRGYETHHGLGGSSGDTTLDGSLPYLEAQKKIDASLRRKKLKGLA